MNADYITNDNLEIVLKTDKLDVMKPCYLAFGWTVTEEYPDKHYFDIVHLSFVRPHKIENKDRLQLLQVRMEMVANIISRLERRINVYTALLSVALFLLGAAIIGCGMALALLAAQVFYLVCGIVIVVAGVLFLVLSLALCTKMYDYYIIKYNTYKEVLTENMRQIVAEASSLTGYSDGNKEQQNN